MFWKYFTVALGLRESLHLPSSSSPSSSNHASLQACTSTCSESLELFSEREKSQGSNQERSTHFQHPVETVATPKPSLTIYQAIVLNPEFATFATFLNRVPHLTTILDDPLSNATLFIPTNRALRERAHDMESLPLEQLEHLLRYHIIPYPLTYLDLLCTPTLPTLFSPTTLNGPERIHVGWTLPGPVINTESRVLRSTLEAKNGYIHPITSPLKPPEGDVWETIFRLPPNEFSVFQSVVRRTGVVERLNGQGMTGGTIFVLTNHCFEQLRNLRESLLYSPDGEEELEKLVGAHIMPNQTLYSNAYYGARCTDQPSSREDGIDAMGGSQNIKVEGNLPHLCRVGKRSFRLRGLDGNLRLVEVIRATRFIEMLVDRTFSVDLFHRDMIAQNGVVHIIDRLFSQ